VITAYIMERDYGKEREKYKPRSSPWTDDPEGFKKSYILNSPYMKGVKMNFKELEEAIWSDPTFDHVYGGKMTLKRDGSVEKPMVIFKVVRGKLTLVKQVGAVQ